MSATSLPRWILRILQSEGPQDFLGLLSLLKSDPKYGYIALRDPQFEAKVRSSLLDHSNQNFEYFIQGFDYKWSAFSTEIIDELESYSIPRNRPRLELGFGSETVYGIFFPSMMRETFRNQATSYPIKIGRTTRPLAERLFELQTGNFLDLQVGLAIHTDSASSLENYLHKLLDHRKINGNNSQSEWFLTTLEFVAHNCRSQLVTLCA